YTATNPYSTASGAYQFTNPTWRRYASAAGVDLSQYPTAASAPPAVQDAVFNQAVSQNGLGDWTCPGCNPALTNYLQANPSQASLPIFASGDQSASTQFPGGGVIPDNGSVTTGNTAANPAASGSSSGGGLTGWLITPIWELMTRAGVFILGMFLLLISLLALLWQSKTVQVNVGKIAG